VLAHAAYCPKAELESWQCDYCTSDLGQGIEVFQSVFNETTHMTFFVGWDHARKQGLIDTSGTC